MQVGRPGPRLKALDADAQIFAVGLGIFDEDVEILLLVENAGVEQLEFGLGQRAAGDFSRPIADKEIRPADTYRGTRWYEWVGAASRWK